MCSQVLRCKDELLCAAGNCFRSFSDRLHTLKLTLSSKNPVNKKGEFPPAGLRTPALLYFLYSPLTLQASLL